MNGNDPMAMVRLMRQTMEIAVAAPAVVALRMMRLAAWGVTPSSRHEREILRMGMEKTAAFSQSWWGMWEQTLQWQTQMWMLALWAPNTAMQRMSEPPVIRIVSAGVTPVHRAAMSNVKRLTHQKH